MTPFKFELGADVQLSKSGELGTVTGRAEYLNSENSYMILYKAADGRQVENWWPESTLAPLKG